MANPNGNPGSKVKKVLRLKTNIVTVIRPFISLCPSTSCYSSDKTKTIQFGMRWPVDRRCLHIRDGPMSIMTSILTIMHVRGYPEISTLSKESTLSQL